MALVQRPTPTNKWGGNLTQIYHSQLQPTKNTSPFHYKNHYGFPHKQREEKKIHTKKNLEKHTMDTFQLHGQFSKCGCPKKMFTLQKRSWSDKFGYPQKMFTLQKRSWSDNHNWQEKDKNKKEKRRKRRGDAFLKQLSKHHLSFGTPSKSVCCSTLGRGLPRKGYTWFAKICSKTIRGLPFFFHSPLDTVYLINDQGTLGAEVKHTVKIKVVEM